MLLRTRTYLALDIPLAPTPFVSMLRPQTGAQQLVYSSDLVLYPASPYVEFNDSVGNLCQRFVAQPGKLTITATAEVDTPPGIDVDPSAPFTEIQFLPNDTLAYLLPSRYCEAEQFGALATQIVEHTSDGYPQVERLVYWIRENIRFEPGSSTEPVTAQKVKDRGFGVCRDLAHLGIALCRSISIPARIVGGYLHGLEPMDLHAWFEAFVGHRWYTFDPTQAVPRGGRVALAYGRDAADIATYTQFGPSVSLEYLEVSVEEAG